MKKKHSFCNSLHPRIFLLKFNFIVFIFLSAFFSAQQNNKEDLLYSKAIKTLYTDPEISEKLGLQLFSNTADVKTKIKALLLLAQVNSILLDYKKSFYYANESLKLAKKNNDYESQINILGFLGIFYQNIELKGLAWSCLNEANELIIKHPLPDSLSYKLGNILLNKAHLYQEDLDCTYANLYYNKAIKLFENAVPIRYSNKINLAVAFTHKALCKLKNNEEDSARYYFNNAIIIANANKSAAVISFAKNGLAELYAQKKDYKKSNAILQESLILAKKSKQMQLELDIYKMLADNYYYLGDDAKAIYFAKLSYRELSDSNNEEASAINKITQSLEEQIDINRSKKNRLTYLVYLLLAVAGIVSLFFIYKIQLMTKLIK
ncbi:tetratricopeptide repeat protein [Epilithonimonas hispanica]|uniref:Tetratricopeptide repeat protein n=1 Tax=Epilithonimonas hispanica TaxID=358687 RepID=A0A3D9D036_9FLAO|nr:tetratricopeptide repeat protein [Epilithonimonas hispanica]REC71268.1 hypothetical protein DRF58_06970 [Epilithonimonas hispanica]